MATSIPRIDDLFDRSVAFAPLLDEIPLGIALLDKDRRVVFLNRALEAITGRGRQEAQGIPCRHILRNNLCPHECPVMKLTAESEAVSLDANIINRSRQRIPVRLTLAPVLDVTGNLTGYVETVEDLQLLKELDDRVAADSRFSHIIGRCAKMERIFQILPVVAQTDSSVLITGETGTGKDLLAEAIHLASNRAKGLFVKVNCGALPETLLESELFGHQKGAFTGAVESKPGRFRLAHNGTLYLTEIGDLPLQLQVKLLTFLDDKVVYPLGGTKGTRVDVRVIAATHRNLEQMVVEGRFREDLLFRLNVVRLHIPPLRDRADDIHLLLDHFIRTFAAKFNKKIEGLAESTRSILLGYHYPGNVRELRNIVEYAVNICDGSRIEANHLPTYIVEPRAVERVAETVQDRSESVIGDWFGNRTADYNWQTAERRMIMEALVKAGGRRREAAALLGWGRSTLWRKMKHYGINQ